LEKIACGDFFGHWLCFRRQKAWFLPPAVARRYARAAIFSDIGFVSGGKKRGLVYLRKGRLPWRVATPGRAQGPTVANSFT
jgi:hypothetical protein